jgi:glycosyltransferase involved in cell wall biosynthesis
MATVTDFGGAERVVLSLIKNINRDRFELVPVLFTRARLLDNIFFKELRGIGKKYFTIFTDNHKIKYLNPLANFFEAYSVLRKNNFDLVHTHGYRCDVLGIIMAKLTGLPVVSTCHGFISNDLNLKFYNTVDRFLLRYADRVMAVSEGIKTDLLSNGIKESRTTLIQNAVEQNGNKEQLTQNRRAKRRLFNIEEKEFVIGYIGRLSEEKGIKYLLEAHTLLTKEGAPIKMLIIGDGSQRKELEKSAKKSGNGGSVIFAGFQNDVEDWLPAMDVFVLPSLTEGTPMSLLEAMAGGIPVVASSVGGVPQVIESGKNGILVSPGKSEEIKKAVLALYSNETLRKSLASEAEKSIKLRYDVRQWIAKVETEYLNATN